MKDYILNLYAKIIFKKLKNGLMENSQVYFSLGQKRD